MVGLQAQVVMPDGQAAACYNPVDRSLQPWPSFVESIGVVIAHITSSDVPHGDQNRDQYGDQSEDAKADR